MPGLQGICELLRNAPAYHDGPVPDLSHLFTRLYSQQAITTLMPNREIHNPSNVTDDQIEAGYRLLYEDERNVPFPPGAQVWFVGDEEWGEPNFTGVGQVPSDNSWQRCTYRVPVVADPLPAGVHNPAGVTADQVGAGYRLATLAELQRCVPSGAQYWDTTDSTWCSSANRGSALRRSNYGYTYRVPAALPAPAPVGILVPDDAIDPIAPGHNRHQLTVSQVGTEYRLLTDEEMRAGQRIPAGGEYWSSMGSQWSRNPWGADGVFTAGTWPETWRVLDPVHRPFDRDPEPGYRLLRRSEITTEFCNDPANSVEYTTDEGAWCRCTAVPNSTWNPPYLSLFVFRVPVSTTSTPNIMPDHLTTHEGQSLRPSLPAGYRWLFTSELRCPPPGTKFSYDGSWRDNGESPIGSDGFWYIVPVGYVPHVFSTSQPSEPPAGYRWAYTHELDRVPATMRYREAGTVWSDAGWVRGVRVPDDVRRVSSYVLPASTPIAPITVDAPAPVKATKADTKKNSKRTLARLQRKLKRWQLIGDTVGFKINGAMQTVLRRSILKGACSRSDYGARDLRSVRNYLKSRTKANVPDPLTLAPAQRYEWAYDPMRCNQRMGKDKPGLMLGIEIEFFYPLGDNATQLLARPPIGVDVGGDGSISPPDSGRRSYGTAELRFIVSALDYSRLYRVGAWLQKLGARVNRSCGLHVHLDARDLTEGSYNAQVKARATAVHEGLSVLKYVVPPSRLSNSYCKLSRPTVSDRYHAVNVCSVSEHRTVEVRLGAGSVNPDKIRLWCECLLHFYRGLPDKAQRKALKTITQPEQAVDWIMRSSLSVPLKFWMMDRVRKFYPEAFPKLGTSNGAEESETLVGATS